MNSSGNTMSSVTRKLSKDDIEWHSRDKGSFSQREGSIGSYGGRERGGSNIGSADNLYGLNGHGLDSSKGIYFTICIYTFIYTYICIYTYIYIYIYICI
jgi:hypothetical protein